jgi:hypothetical protein
MKLKDLIRKDTDTLTATVEYRHGLKLKLRYVSRAELVRISRESTILKYDEKVKGRVPSLDGVKFAGLFCAAAVVGWEGATPETLASMMPLDLSTLTKEQRGAEIEFSVEQLQFLLENTFELETFIQDAALDVRTFNPLKEEEEKNLQPSQSGN